MNCTHGTRWDDEKIKKAILRVKDACELDRMPSRKECVGYFGDNALTSAVSKRYGGWYALAKEMGLPIKKSETYFGKRQEGVVCEMLIARGFEVERMSQNFPYDILVDNCVKVDVKASHLYRGNQGNFFTFNLEKKYATCDVYVLLTLDDDNNITNYFIVPSCFVIRNTQISMGEHVSKYHKYKDRWDYIDNLSKYFMSLEVSI
jgi:hypothetical protein